MFKLQRLEITGFKSFADYTEIVFTDNGITAVVGPNGCGKSNVSDSFAWVLGEQRAKSLRGEEMKDVVFQGTNKRSASGMAEVVLHLVRDETIFDSEEAELEDIDEALSDIDENALEVEELDSAEEPIQTSQAVEPSIESQNGNNGFHSDENAVEKLQPAQVAAAQSFQITKSKRRWRPRTLALDFMPGEAVSVTRRLHRSGDSEYLLNGRACRLRDIQDLFAGTGLSGAHYALIEQGRIGQILSAKPADRRNLIEEAAGISKFRTRQRATEARLESAKGNLSRITDIVSEIEKQANALRRQAARTRRYKILREELREILGELFAAEGKHLTALVNDLDEKLKEAAKFESETFREVEEKEEIFRTATVDAREAEENLSIIRQKHSDNALQRDRDKREIEFQSQQINSLNERSAVLQNEIKNAEQRLKLIGEENKRLAKDEQKERSEAERAELALKDAEAKYQGKALDVNNIEFEIENQRTELLRHSTAVERFAEIQRQIENNSERIKERAEGLQREGDRAEKAYEEYRAEAAQLDKILKAEREKLNKLHSEKSASVQSIQKSRNNFNASENEMNSLRADFSHKRNRLETLQELEEKRNIYAPSIKKLFEEQSKIGVKFSGVLADRLNVEQKAEKAVENLFGTYLQAILVSSEKDAKKTIEYVNKNKFGRVAVLVENGSAKSQAAKSNQNQSKIVSLLGVDDGLAKLLEEIFQREMSAKFVEKTSDVKSEKGESFVTSNGSVSFGGKLFVGGLLQTNEQNTTILAFKRELRELESLSQKLSKQLEKAEKETDVFRKELSEKEDKLVDLQSLIVKVERELMGQEIQSKTLAQEIERASRHQKVVADESAQIEAELAELLRKHKETKSNAAAAEKARETASQMLEKSARKLAEARQKLEAENSVLNQKRTLSATSEERRRSASNSLRRIENERAELNSRIERFNTETQEIKQRIVELNKFSAELSKKINASQSEETSEQKEITAAKNYLQSARDKSDLTSTQLAELNKKSAEARNKRAEIEIQRTETIERLRAVNEHSETDLNVSLVELVENQEVSDDFNLDEARESARVLRNKIENFGSINMLALEELAEVEERFDFLSTQRSDIVDGISAAEAALREIKQRSRQKFREAFSAINANFIEFFQELFGGGHGEMTLIESEDILESGIEIVAQPPGKRLQNILLLSGGEKAMTAIALVLAIFKYRPAPFCLLDEVDAPLDDANVGRFVNKIAEMSEKTQFIVITHNKRTMEAARALYGITMEEPGISKVVSVKFE